MTLWIWQNQAIKEYCMPNAIFTFREYLNDFASKQRKRHETY